MKRIVILLVVISIILTACSSVRQLAGQALEQAGKTLKATGANSTQPVEQAIAFTLTSANPTCTPTFSPLPMVQISDARLKASLQDVINSPAWKNLGLSQSLIQKWSAFAQGNGALSDSERSVLGDFLNQWDQWNQLAGGTLVPSGATPALRVRELEKAQGEQRLVVYVIDEKDSQADGSERLFLIGRDASGKAIGLLLAPRIENLQQRINPDSAYVQYVTTADKCILLADARQLENSGNEKTLKERLDQIYVDNPYTQASIYPRFRYNVTGEAAGFFAIETTLTYNQVIRLQEALDLFNRPDFEPFKPQIFADGIAYVVVDKIGNAAGLTYSGTGVVELDRRDLFGNRYELASVIAHEGSHVLQGALKNDGEPCKQILAREIGDGTIPQDFYSWDANQLLQAIKDGTIGAYHVSLWSMYKLGLTDLDWVRQAIRTGQVNGQSVVLCK